MSRRGILLVISGFAGSGKGSITKRLLSDYDNYSFSVSATTRAARPGEVDGKDYFFVTKERFQEMIDNNEFLEYAHYVSNSYGTPRQYVEDRMNEGKDVILEIECQGALNVKRIFPEALLVFVTPPTVEEVYNRLRKRGTETEEVIMSRMRRGQEEAEIIKEYDYLLVNDDLDMCVVTLNGIVNGARYSVSRSIEYAEDIKKQFEVFLEGE